jgi:hypothetical protein
MISDNPNQLDQANAPHLILFDTERGMMVFSDY